jgi:hypothetical protein
MASNYACLRLLIDSLFAFGPGIFHIEQHHYEQSEDSSDEGFGPCKEEESRKGQDHGYDTNWDSDYEPAEVYDNGDHDESASDLASIYNHIANGEIEGDEVVPKRKRGRPRKSLQVQPIADIPVLEPVKEREVPTIAGEDGEVTAGTLPIGIAGTVVQETPKKRGPGRPRKSITVDSRADPDSVTIDAGETVLDYLPKRKRGRPRKYAVVSSDVPRQGEEEDETASLVLGHGMF